MKDNNWKKRIGVGEPVRLLEAFAVGTTLLVVFAGTSATLVDKQYLDTLATGFLYTLIGLLCIEHSLDLERRLKDRFRTIKKKQERIDRTSKKTNKERFVVEQSSKTQYQTLQTERLAERPAGRIIEEKTVVDA